METVATTELLPLPPFRGGAIFNVSVDSPPWEGETEEDRAARVNRNVNRAQRRANEAALAMAEAQLDSQGRPRQLHRNLDDEFIHVDGHDVYKTPSANLAMAANELAWLPQTSEVAKVAAMLKAVHCQVNEIRQDQGPSYLSGTLEWGTPSKHQNKARR